MVLSRLKVVGRAGLEPATKGFSEPLLREDRNFLAIFFA